MPTTTRKRTYKGDDLTKTASDRKRGGSRYEPWESAGRRKKAAKRSTRKKRTTRR